MRTKARAPRVCISSQPSLPLSVHAMFDWPEQIHTSPTRMSCTSRRSSSLVTVRLRLFLDASSDSRTIGQSAFESASELTSCSANSLRTVLPGGAFPHTGVEIPASGAMRSPKVGATTSASVAVGAQRTMGASIPAPSAWAAARKGPPRLQSIPEARSGDSWQVARAHWIPPPGCECWSILNWWPSR